MKKLKAIDAAAIIPGHGPVMQDQGYLDLVIGLLEATSSRATDAQKRGLSQEQAIKSVDLRAFRKRTLPPPSAVPTAKPRRDPFVMRTETRRLTPMLYNDCGQWPRAALRLAASLFALTATLTSVVRAQVTPRSRLPTTADWLADLGNLAREMPLRHRNLFHDLDSASYRRQIAELRQRIPTASTDEILVGFFRLGSSIHDAHSGISTASPALAFESLPIVVYLYDDGLYIQGTDSAHASLLGARITRVGRLSADSAVRVAATVTDASNPMTVAAFVHFRLVHPALLHALGVTDRSDRTTLVVEQNGRERTVELPSMGRDASGLVRPGASNYWPGPQPGLGWLDARPTASTPLWLQHPDSMYWSTYLPASHTLYAQCNQIGNGLRKPFSTFFERLLQRADSTDVDRLVLDLRQNGGGNNMLLEPAVDAFIRSRIARERGRLFVIIGRLTQSAAQNFVNRLELQTQAIFVGEPTGERPNMYGDPLEYTLPRTGLQVALATLWWQDLGPLDERQWTGPYLASPLTAADYHANRDPSLETILAWRVDTPFGERLQPALAAGDSTELARVYDAFVHDPLHRWTDVSETMLALADSLSDVAASSQGTAAAIARNEAVWLLRFNVRDHPRSPRAYTALAAALASAARAPEAVAAARLAIRLDPHQAQAREIVATHGRAPLDP